MELVALTENVFYLSAATNVGVVANDSGQAVLVDTGIDQQAAKKTLKMLEEHKLKPVAVINTHSHADHIGGNQFLQDRLGIPVYAPEGEAPFIANPSLEPLYLLGGTVPWKDMKNKFLCARPSEVTPIAGGETSINIAGIQLDIHRLPGHSHDQIGVFARGVMFCGDAFLAPEYLQKHGIPYNVDIAGYFASLERILSLKASVTVPAHGGELTDPGEVIGRNWQTVQQQVERVEQIISRNPCAVEDVVAGLCGMLNFNISLPTLYFLYRTTVTAYLGYLLEAGRAQYIVRDNRLVWSGK
ncbi:zinc metallohydrolase [Desulfocucumis palustris]|uniref:beta-lactamase n=1 Tax=Desulfocucumis palustris TaxID=1898651 RepID=A0A2L2XBI2_9FIRM|nr:MBL fold metallo-hydrolase [Desulfocucumis palustris]GBF33043.1 zinc metallohydrolase [Desulfocucumis palustris]